MAIPFLDLVRNMKARLFPSAGQTKAVSTVLVRAEKDKSERLRKTVLPKTNAARTKPAVEPVQVEPLPVEPLPVTPRTIQPISESIAKSAAIPPPPPTPPVTLPKIPFDPAPKFSGAPEIRKPVAFSLSPQPLQTPQPPQTQPPQTRQPQTRQEQTRQPNVERTISLQISDILDQLPSERIKPRDSFDPARGILLRASEVEKGMACGKPSVSLVNIYQQAPEIFLQNVSLDDSTMVLLPFNKVLEQFKALRVRQDQESDPDVPQLDTPFLKVTLEDTERFGTAIKPPQTSLHPPVKIETATAKALAAAEPEPAVLETVKPAPVAPAVSTDQPSKADPAPVRPAKIPFHLPPNGTGAPASEKVPASSGPPVPTVPMPATRGRIPLTKPSEQLRPKFTLVPGVEPKEKTDGPTSSFAEVVDSPRNRDQQSRPEPVGAKVALPLQPLLQTLPTSQLNGSPMTVGADVRVEFPLPLIEPQLASGRVVVPAKVFQRAIPEKHRALFTIDPNETPVSLPLQEVLHHLPPTTLRLRADQEEVTLKENFTTPFSLQAEEDAKHFEAMAAAALKVSEDPAQEADIKSSESETPSVPDPAEEETVNSPKVVIACASLLPGVKACALTFADGLSLAGNFPPELTAEGVCAMAPPILHKIDNHLGETKLGALVAMTLRCKKSALTFFMHGSICLTALHADGEELALETREQLAGMVQELSGAYSKPEPSHVDH